MVLTEEQSQKRLNNYIETAEKWYNKWMDDPSFKNNLIYQTAMYNMQKIQEEHNNQFYPF